MTVLFACLHLRNGVQDYWCIRDGFQDDLALDYVVRSYIVNFKSRSRDHIYSRKSDKCISLYILL